MDFIIECLLCETEESPGDTILLVHVQDGDAKYSLYAVLVHAGWSTHSGHYYCFVRTDGDTWHALDDSRVSASPPVCLWYRFLSICMSMNVKTLKLLLTHTVIA